MISIIICNQPNNNLLNLQKNISETIGVDFEILIFDNIKNDGICEVYNSLSNIAKYSILLFLHNDVILRTENWGKILFDLLNNINIGLVGVSGSIYKSKFTSSWTACKEIFYRINTLQHYNHRNNPILHQINPLNQSYSKVAVIDGVFMAIRKELFKTIRFDDNLLTGFHGYDLDISLQMKEKYDVIVAHNILIEHFSPGSFDHNWLTDLIKIHKKWNKELPIFINNNNKSDYKSDYIALFSLMSHLMHFQSNNLLKLKYYFVLNTYYLPLNKFKFTKTILKSLLKNK